MDETELYTLRWKGKLIGPLSLAMLQEKFLTGELSLAHEIQVGEHWLTLRNFLSANPALVTMSSAAPAEETQTFTLRWRGKTMGPYTWAEISEKLSTGELSLAHEIQIGEQWLPLRSCASTDGRPPQAPVDLHRALARPTAGPVFLGGDFKKTPRRRIEPGARNPRWRKLAIRAVHAESTAPSQRADKINRNGGAGED